MTKPERITDEKWLNLYRVPFDSNGRTGQWCFASRKAEPRHGTGPLEADAVIVVAIHSSGRLVVNREFRHPIGDWEYGFPAGLVEDGEDYAAAAIRELKQETGLDATKVVCVSPAVISSAGLSDESVSFVYLECDGELSRDFLEESEDIHAELLDLDGCVKLLKSGAKFSVKFWTTAQIFIATGEITFPASFQLLSEPPKS